eukprot:TRINITY_DN2383_c0_g3_i1.p3 TRINITY_DN2383_c0_g3~~TRINITY_DN2383_c0_g3_i1.p3  ORF type:complete len:116 (-),score=31.97 TRINITY_DN2383_c0_g3_i1:33-380(-)
MLGNSAEIIPGLYVSGWVKRGPSGVIGTNRTDAEETVDSLYKDITAGKLASTDATTATTNNPVRELLESRGVQVVDFDGWKRIDQQEMARGKPRGKQERDKFTVIAEMLRIARGE